MPFLGSADCHDRGDCVVKTRVTPLIQHPLTSTVAGRPAVSANPNMARSLSRRAGLLLAMALSMAGCSFLLPHETRTTQHPWKTFAEAQLAFDAIVPKQTSTEDLKGMGLDPFTSPNIKVLTYLELMARLMPHDSFQRSDLDAEVRACLDAKDRCRAFELIVEASETRRTGNAFLDLFGFRRNVHTTGWYFDALLIVQDDVVVYKISSGQPNVDRTEKRTKPLGPLQELDDILGAAAGKAI